MRNVERGAWSVKRGAWGRPALYALLPTFLVAGCMAAPRPSETADLNVQSLHIHLATDGVRLGGYTFVVKWDPKLAMIEEIRPCSASKFPGRPEHPPMSRFINGSIRIWGVTADRQHEVPPEYDLVTIRFRGPGSGRVPVTVQTEALYDTQKRPKPISGRLNAFPAELAFPSAAP